MTPKTLKRIRTSLKVVVWSMAIFSISVMVLLTLILDNKAKYSNASSLSSSNLKLATSFVRRISKTIINTKKTITVQASSKELNSTLAFVNRAYTGFSGDVKVVDDTAIFSVSIRIPILGKMTYLNSQATLLNSDGGLRWSQVKLSSMDFSDKASNYLFKKLIQALLGKRYGNSIIAGIDSVKINNQALEFTFSPPGDLQKGFAKAIERISAYSGQSLHFDTERVQHYLAFLVDLTRSLPQQNISAAVYLKVLMTEAHRQTTTHDLSASRENLAAIYALSIQVAPGIFRHFVDDLKVNRLNATVQPKLTLNTRHDLAKHFVYSAALHILAEKGMSFSIGEAKEILDTDKGGSGFSFADITADLSGIRFAQLAISDDDNAQRIQALCALSLGESDFFPSIDDMPEGLSEKAFKDRFTDIHSNQYKAQIKTIETRITLLPLFQSNESKGNEAPAQTTKEEQL